MKICAYTSCSINYLPKARALAHSLKRHHPDAVIALCLSDVVPSWLDLAQEPFDMVWLPEDLGFSSAWTFKHNVMEVCTGVKGRALVRLLEEQEADLYLYLDPDVFVYQPLDPMLDYMGTAQIGLVPHITKPETTDLGVRITEMSVAAHGTYNLGHLLLRDGPSARAFAAWWDARLTDFCYDSKEEGLFTDQRWCDLVPALFDDVAILRQPNMDVASWNIFGRSLEQTEGGDEPRYRINGFPLLTYHFSGTGPTGTHRWVRERVAAGCSAVAEIERRYEQAIEAQGQAQLEHFAYGGNFFEDGQRIDARVRKLYRDHQDLQEAFPHPYRTFGDHSYLHWLRECRPELVNGVVVSEDRLDQAFHDLFNETFYLERYPDARQAIADGKFDSALDHYVMLGSKLLYDPNVFFVTRYYFEKAQVLSAFSARKLAPASKESTWLWHYLTVGLPNGLEPIEHFSSTEYLRQNGDVASGFRTHKMSTPLAHFAQFGDCEGRKLPADLDLSAYAAGSAIARALMEDTGCGPFEAFVRLGMVEGRIDQRLAA